MRACQPYSQNPCRKTRICGNSRKRPESPLFSVSPICYNKLICSLAPEPFGTGPIQKEIEGQWIMEYSVNHGAWNAVFAVPSSLVDQHIRLAGALQLKVLLWVLRHAGERFTPEMIAEAVGASAADVRDAMQYWTITGLLSETAAQDDDAPSAAAPAPQKSTADAHTPASLSEPAANPPARQAPAGDAAQTAAASAPNFSAPAAASAASPAFRRTGCLPRNRKLPPRLAPNFSARRHIRLLRRSPAARRPNAAFRRCAERRAEFRSRTGCFLPSGFRNRKSFPVSCRKRKVIGDAL